MKRVISFIMIVICLMTCSVSADFNLLIDDVKVNLVNRPFLMSDTIMLPLREVMEYFFYDVHWNPSVGGVDIKVTKKEAKEVTSHKGRYGNVKLKAGTHTLNGKQALAYCRIRKIDTDFNRTQRQRTVMSALLDKAKKNPFRLYKMANAGAEYIETDLTKAQLKGVAAFAGMCVSGEMFQEKVPFEGTWEYANKGGASVIAINIDKNKEMLIDYIYNKTAKELKAQQEQNGKK